MKEFSGSRRQGRLQAMCRAWPAPAGVGSHQIQRRGIIRQQEDEFTLSLAAGHDGACTGSATSSEISRDDMSPESRKLAGILLVVLPTVAFGGVSILTLLIADPGYMHNPLRQDLWRAGHAHAGVLLILVLVALRYVDEAVLGDGARRLVRAAIPSAAILLPSAFFLSVLSPDATEPNALIYLAYLGAVVLSLGLIVLGVGLIRRPRAGADPGADVA